MEYGLQCKPDLFTNKELVEYAKRAEACGVTNIWVRELYGRDPFVTSGVLLSATTTIRVGTSIANVYARDPIATKSAAYSLADFYGNRFDLGLGLANKVVNEPRGVPWHPPLEKITDFIDRYDATELSFEAEGKVARYLAAHGPRLLNFAAERLDGAYSYLQTIAYTREAKQALGRKKLHLMQPTVFSHDTYEARSLGRDAVAIFLPHANYHRAWRERGFADSDFANGGSDAFIDELVAWGDHGKIATRYAEQTNHGADHIIIVPIGIDLRIAADWKNIERLVNA